MASSEPRRFDLRIDVDGRAVGKMRNEVTLTIVQPYADTWELASDERDFHGGDGTAPSPLTLFAAGLITCFMTQVRAFAKRLRVPLRDVRVRARCEWQGEQVGREPYVALPVGFTLEVELDSDAGAEDQVRLIEAAKRGCFAEATVTQATPIHHRLKVGGEWREV